MKNKNNEIIAILLSTLSLFILLSLIGFKTEYEISDIYNFIINSNYYIDPPITGPLGAGISALLKKYAACDCD